MNRDEQLVEVYLKSLGLGEVVYEPDGNVPPDFLLGCRVAVEVRRLNQHYEAAGRAHGLEEDSLPLWQSFTKLLAEFGRPRDNRTWFVFFRIKRPFLPWRVLGPLVRAALERFLQRPFDGTVHIPIESGFEISLILGSTVDDFLFVPGGNTDMDSGGWVVSEILRNLSVYIDEKTEKVTPYRHKYPTWWFVLVDYIGYARDEAELRKYFESPPGWDRVVLLSPVDGRAYEI